MTVDVARIRAWRNKLAVAHPGPPVGETEFKMILEGL